MTDYKITQWEYSSVKKQVFGCPPDGPAYLKIEDAWFDDDERIYRMTMHDLGSDLTFDLSYWLTKKDGTPNRSAEGTLISLGESLYGQEVGIPNPVDIVGGVVVGDIKSSETSDEAGNVRRWPRCYKFSPVPKDIAVSYADIAQYSTE